MPIHVIKIRIRFVIEPDDEGFHAFCPDLKGLHVNGATEEEALENAKQAISLYMESLIKHEDPIPVGVLTSHTRYGWSDLLHFVRRMFSAERERAYVEEITLNACA